MKLSYVWFYLILIGIIGLGCTGKSTATKEHQKHISTSSKELNVISEFNFPFALPTLQTYPFFYETASFLIINSPLEVNNKLLAIHKGTGNSLKFGYPGNNRGDLMTSSSVVQILDYEANSISVYDGESQKLVVYTLSDLNIGVREYKFKSDRFINQLGLWNDSLFIASGNLENRAALVFNINAEIVKSLENPFGFKPTFAFLNEATAVINKSKIYIFPTYYNAFAEYHFCELDGSIILQSTHQVGEITYPLARLNYRMIGEIEFSNYTIYGFRPSLIHALGTTLIPYAGTKVNMDERELDTLYDLNAQVMYKAPMMFSTFLSYNSNLLGFDLATNRYFLIQKD